jgi:hypothetical protein
LIDVHVVSGAVEDTVTIAFIATATNEMNSGAGAYRANV